MNRLVQLFPTTVSEKGLENHMICDVVYIDPDEVTDVWHNSKNGNDEKWVVFMKSGSMIGLSAKEFLKIEHLL
jgi:hypothetical protein